MPSELFARIATSARSHDLLGRERSRKLKSPVPADVLTGTVQAVYVSDVF